MSSAPLWLVGSRERVEAQARAWTSARFAPIALPWSVLESRLAPTQVLAALRYHRPDLVLLTSPFSVAMLEGGSAEGRAAACVGEATAMAARAAGFDPVLVGREGALALADAVLARVPRPRRLLWLRGEEAVAEGAARLEGAGLEVQRVVTYAARALPDFPERVRAAPEPGAVLAHSPKAADALADALLGADRVLPRDCGLYALGNATAARLRDLGFAGAISVAPGDLRALLDGLA